MRAFLLSALAVGLSLLPLQAEPLIPASTALTSSAGIVEAAVAAAPVVTSSPDNLALRTFALLAGVLLMVIAGYMAFGPRPRHIFAPIPVDTPDKE